MTIVVNVEDHPLEQVTKQLNKLVNVLKIVELEPAACVRRELILVKVRADDRGGRRCWRPSSSSAPRWWTSPGRGGRGDRQTDKLEALLRVLEPFGIKELVQSGLLAVGRGARSITDRSLRPSSAPPRDQHRASADRPGSQPRRTRKTRQWQRCSTTTTPTSRSSRAAGRRPRLRQPGPRARAVAARLRRGRAGRPAGGLEVPGEGREQGLRVVTPAEACEEADLIMILVPDPVQRQVYEEAIAPNLEDGDALFFGHGLNIHFDLIKPPADVDVVHGRAEGPGPPGAPPVRRGPRRARAGRRRAGRHRQRAGRWRCPTRRASAAPGPAS